MDLGGEKSPFCPGYFIQHQCATQQFWGKKRMCCVWLLCSCCAVYWEGRGGLDLGVHPFQSYKTHKHINSIQQYGLDNLIRLGKIENPWLQMLFHPNNNKEVIILKLTFFSFQLIYNNGCWFYNHIPNPQGLFQPWEVVAWWQSCYWLRCLNGHLTPHSGP